MTEQNIGFCTASDGVRIAYATLGEGPPLVYVSGWPVHLQVEWEKPAIRAFLQDLSRGRTLIRYDMRGSGLSDRDICDFSLHVLQRDLEAVVDHLRMQSFALLSLGDLAGPLAISYAASHPERVTHLILNSAYIRGADILPPERRQAVIEYTRNFGFPAFQFTDSPGVEVEKQRDVLDVMAAASSYDVQAALLTEGFTVDVSDPIGRVTAPALVLHARQEPWVPFPLGREVALALPRSRFVAYEGSSNAPWIFSDVLTREIHSFLGVHPPETMRARASRPDDATNRLTARELDVLRLIASGRTSRQVAGELVLSVRTVERHISNVYRKLDVHSRAEVTAHALREGLLDSAST